MHDEKFALKSGANVSHSNSTFQERRRGGEEERRRHPHTPL
jgi:hypothetical protein